MRKFAIALALALAPGLAFAQQAQGPGQGSGMRGGLAGALLQQRTELQLTAEQVARLEAIEKEQATKSEAFRAQMQQQRQERAQMTEQERQAFRAQMDGWRDQTQASADAARKVLTEQQHQRWQEMVQARHEQRVRERPMGQRGDRPMQGRSGQRGGQRGGMRTPPSR